MTKRMNTVKFLIGFVAAMTIAASSMVTHAAANTNQTSPAYVGYASKDGWRTQYDKNSFEVNETKEGTYFVYTGDCAGTCYVGLSVVNRQSAKEVLYEKTANWNPANMMISEGLFQGDKWQYTRILTPSAGEVPVYQMYKAAEYNGRVFLIEAYETMGNNEGINMKVSDSIAMVIDAIEFNYYESQTEFNYYVGTYEYKYDDVVDGQLQTFTYTITLNPDHTGVLMTQDIAEVYWGSYELYMRSNWNDRKEFTIEGNNLLINLGHGNWVTFTSVEEEDLD